MRFTDLPMLVRLRQHGERWATDRFLRASDLAGAANPEGRDAWKCVGIRSNQSATGTLYVTLAFVLIGEIIAAYFLTSRGLVI